MRADRFTRIDAFCHRHVLAIAVVGVLFSAVCYSQTGPALDCRNKAANAFGTLYRPPESSNQALRLACNGKSFIAVKDGLMYGGFQ